MNTEQQRTESGKPFNLVNLAAKFFLILILAGAAGFALWTWTTLKYVYSRGERAGYVQKISQKGWVFKTWEGELTMVSLPGTTPEQFLFTVRDGVVVSDIQKTLGQRVVLTYEQHRGIPLSIFGETQHYVTGVMPAGDSAPGINPISLPSK